MPARDLPTKVWTTDRPFRLEHGGELPGLRIAYETWGSPSRTPGETVVVLHALSGSSHAFRSAENPEPGWWERFLEPGAPIHPDRQFIICANILGGCYGTTGPRSVDPKTGRPYGARFPQITIRDMVEAQRLLLEALGIEGPVTLIGGSMGGMLVLQWAVDHPHEVARAVVLCAPARSYPQTIALRAVQREAILCDPLWNGGDYDDARFPARGLALARKIGMITYRSDREFRERFGRRHRDPRPHFLEGRFEVQSYLDHQGEKFVARFDPNTYLYFSRAMDLYDLAEGYGSLEKAFARVQARTLLVAVDTDILCPVEQVEEVRSGLERAGRDVTFGLVRSIHGHDAFLIETAQIHALLHRFFAGAPC